MSMSPTEPIVDKTGRVTVPFQREREELRNGVLTCLEADLATIKPVPGWVRFVLDTGQLVVGDGVSWNVVGAPQSGSNENGEWVRFPDGTQICWGRVSISPTPNVASEGTWVFPATFAFPPEVQATTYAAPLVLTRPAMLSGLASVSSVTINIVRSNSTITSNSVKAIGRWF